MRYINVFKLNGKRIEYTDRIKQAVLDPNIRGLRIHLNCGWDWIDCKYGFVKLLLSRGQVTEVTTHSDLLAREDYLQAAYLGTYNTRKAVTYFFEHQDKPGCASSKRMQLAVERFQAFKQQQIKAGA